jgi:hypothetical protein
MGIGSRTPHNPEFGMQSAKPNAGSFMRAATLIFASALLAAAQDDIGRYPTLVPGDMAVLESAEIRKDLGCNVVPAKAQLGLDLKFHAGFNVEIPMRELVGPVNILSIIFRVSPQSGDPLYFQERIHVPAITATQGTATLDGKFDLGEGGYHVDWLLRDSAGRFCSAYWDVDAALEYKDHDVELMLPPGAVRPNQNDQFEAEPPVARSVDPPTLNIKILMNFAPQNPDSTTLTSTDQLALTSILRALSRNPRLARFSLVVFNLQEQQILYRQDSSDLIDFPRLGQSLKNLNLGTVALAKLENKHGEADFLSTLMKTETGGKPDGLIFISPKAMLNANVPEDDLKQIGDLNYPVFYMNYCADPTAIPWKDSIGRVVKFFKGREMTITGPRDLWNAVTDVVSRIVKFRQTKLTTGD